MLKFLVEMNFDPWNLLVDMQLWGNIFGGGAVIKKNYIYIVGAAIWNCIFGGHAAL